MAAAPPPVWPTPLGTVQPANPFNPEAASTALRKAMKGLGTDEAAIIKILTTHCNAQRIEIEKVYKQMHGRTQVRHTTNKITMSENAIAENNGFEMIKRYLMFLLTHQQLLFEVITSLHVNSAKWQGDGGKTAVSFTEHNDTHMAVSARKNTYIIVKWRFLLELFCVRDMENSPIKTSK
ncbi:annexin [Elysia marginata]|uniref:Annexin n=1 Tax=Elysia marginata TaxID=1093978 RepID=A0AAV4HL36_9GAST|nr:annexin [Elysia marginata]